MADDHNSSEPSPERAQKRAVERRHERTETVEDALSRVSGLFEEEKYPVTAEELAVEYGDEVIDLPNETESLGSVFDRLVDEEFASPQEAREVVYRELTGEAAGSEEYNEQRELDELESGSGD